MSKTSHLKLIRPFILIMGIHVLLQLISIPAIYAAGRKKEVLILNSYHKGYKWTDDITRGIESVLGPYSDSISPYIEYMDSKRNADDAYFKHLFRIYRYKFKDRKFDVIISSDDNAFNFLKRYRNDLFSKTPVVFCGVNYFKQEDLKGKELFTGVNEEADLKSGLELALSLHPGTRRIFIINDRTTTGKKIHDRLMNIIPEYQNEIQFSFLEDVSMEEIQDKVKILPPHTLVFYSFFFRDKNGRFFEYDESISLISEKSKVPIYGAWDFSLGFGIVGGMLTSGFFQGETAAKLAFRIINGENISQVKVVQRSPNRYMFDYFQMDRFGIKKSDLPGGSIIINKPPSFYDEYKTLSWLIIFCITVLLLMVLILSMNIFHQKKAEKKIKEANDQLEQRVRERTVELSVINEQLKIELAERKKAEALLKESEIRFQDLYESSRDAYVMVDISGRLIEYNSTFKEMLGYDDHELKQKTYKDITPAKWHQEEERILKDQVFNRGYSKIYEKEYMRKDGTVFPVEIRTYLLKDKLDSPKFMWAFIRDVTERKKEEEERRRLQNQLLQVQKLDAIGTMAGGMAHDFNNLLMTILGNTSMLLSEMDSSHPEYENLKSIEESIQEGTELTKQLLGFARGGKYEVKPTNINRMIQKSVDMFGRSRKEIKIQTKYAEDIWTIDVDQGQINQVLMNLYMNAWQAMPSGGDLLIETSNISMNDKYASLHEVVPGRTVP